MDERYLICPQPGGAFATLVAMFDRTRQGRLALSDALIGTPEKELPDRNGMRHGCIKFRAMDAAILGECGGAKGFFEGRICEYVLISEAPNGLAIVDFIGDK